jgi:hypothetical protein
MRAILLILALAIVAALGILTAHLVVSFRARDPAPDVTWAPGASGPGRIDVEHSQPMPLPTLPTPAPAGPPPRPGGSVPGRSGSGD